MKIGRILYYIMLAGYLAGIYHGRIAIWQGEDPEPRVVLPYYASTLPEADRAALEKGIRLPTNKELIRFLEDYCS